MSKVFGIGFYKTGTTSLSSALDILGYNVIHGDQRSKSIYKDGGITLVRLMKAQNYKWEIFNHFDAFTDVPYSIAWREIYNMFPDAKYIY